MVVYQQNEDRTMGKLFFVDCSLEKDCLLAAFKQLYLGDFQIVFGVASTKLFFRLTHVENVDRNLGTT